MNCLERELYIKHSGSISKGVLQIKHPILEEDTNDWVCYWRCDIVKSSFFPIHAEDNIAAYYYTLNFISSYFIEIKKFGFEVWQNEIGDNGGFQFKA
jgi:hypothetical protein